jgi:3-phenylpropionate/trans-cinnamate dioxygenase ferredoxin component
MMPWIDACSTDDIDAEDLIRWDHGGRTFAIYHAPDGAFYATEGLCSHEQVHLCDGLVLGHLIECPKHNGQFDYRTGEAKRAPVCVNLQTYPVKVEGGRVFVSVP